MKRKLLLIVIIIILALGMMGISGCESYDPAEVAGYSQQATELNSRIAELQQQVSPLLESLAASGMLDAESAAKAEKLLAEIQQVQTHLQEVSTAINNYNYTETGVAGIIQSLQAANTGSSGFNPYAPYVSLGLGVAAAIAAAVAKRKTDLAGGLETAVAEIVAGIEQFKKLTNDKEKLKAALTAAESINTQKTVAAIRKDITV